MGEPLTPSGVFLRNGLLALGFDEASANERIVAIEDEARAAAPSPTQIAIEHVKNMDRPMEAHEVERLERWVDVPGYGRMPARLMDPFECICDIEDTLAHHPEKAETFAREIAALLDSGEQDGLDASPTEMCADCGQRRVKP